MGCAASSTESVSYTNNEVVDTQEAAPVVSPITDDSHTTQNEEKTNVRTSERNSEAPPNETESMPSKKNQERYSKSEFGLSATGTIFSPVTGYWLAKLAQYAYMPQDACAKKLAGDKFGLINFAAFDRDETQCYVAGNSEVIVIAFRGTEMKNEEDWKTDFNSTLVPSKDVSGKVHAGFLESLEDVTTASATPADVAHGVHADIATAVTSFLDKGQAIFVTGHSLGGALALLAAVSLTNANLPVEAVYTFGAPRVGDEDFGTAYDKLLHDRTHCIINNLDNVPNWFSSSLVRVGQLTHICRDGKTLLPATSTALIAEDIESSSKLIEEQKTFDGAPVEINIDHSIKAYATALENNS